MNSFAHQWRQHDMILASLQFNDLFKGGVFILTFWWLWFKKEGRPAREYILATIAASLGSLVVARLLAGLLPYRVRPMYNPAIQFISPDGAAPVGLEGWSAFPSDHATFFFALATGIGIYSRRIGATALLYAFFAIQTEGAAPMQESAELPEDLLSVRPNKPSQLRQDFRSSVSLVREEVVRHSMAADPLAHHVPRTAGEVIVAVHELDDVACRRHLSHSVIEEDTVAKKFAIRHVTPRGQQLELHSLEYPKPRPIIIATSHICNNFNIAIDHQQTSAAKDQWGGIPKAQLPHTCPSLEQLFQSCVMWDRARRDRATIEAIQLHRYSHKAVADHLQLPYSSVSKIMAFGNREVSDWESR